MPTILFLEKPKNFSFRQTLFSHGWSQLLPFKVSDENLPLRLSYIFTGADLETPLAAEIFEANENIQIEIAENDIKARTKEKIARDVRHILRFDDDLREFYKIVRSKKELAWIAKQNAGRLLRSPTVFEDLIKTVCTTNCSWALTRKMTANLVEKLGEKSKTGESAFPTAEAMASVSSEFYRDEIRAGYRSTYFAELAESVASGRINPESWLDSDLPTADLKKEMKRIKGVGDYAAENLLKLVGRYDGLALDSYLRAQFYRKHGDGQICADEKIEKFYESFGIWRGLTMWCDMSGK
jgi:3-methyladenine DNA glycosylase/8-oxoguanine DNA glycosylase